MRKAVGTQGLVLDEALTKFAKTHADYNLNELQNEPTSIEGNEEVGQFIKRASYAYQLSSAIVSAATHQVKVASFLKEISTQPEFASILKEGTLDHVGIGISASWFGDRFSRP